MCSLLVFHAGGALLACPITDPGVQEVKVLFPGSGEVNQPPGDPFIHYTCGHYKFFKFSRCTTLCLL